MRRQREEHLSASDAAAMVADGTAPAPAPLEMGVLEAAIRNTLAEWRQSREKRFFTEELVRGILDHGREVVMSEPMLVPVPAPVNICGDIHGQIHDLVTILQTGGMPPHARYLFLGDYVDRGKHGVECFCLLLGLKILYPKHVFMLRGNHESAMLTRQYGFFDEVKRRFSVKLWKKFVDVFNCLPVAALVEDAALCMHGGLSPELVDLAAIQSVTRPLEIPDKGLVCDLLWADPESGAGWRPSERGVSYIFGEDVVNNALADLDVDLIVRAHQVQDGGYQFFAGRKLVTVFSATNYCGEFTNRGAMLHVDGGLKCSFQLFAPVFAQGGITTRLLAQ